MWRPCWRSTKCRLLRRNYVSLNSVQVTAHISYPDKENFGRKVISMGDDKLLKSFDEQYALFKGIKSIKPHGALNNELNKNYKLSELFVDWCVKNRV